jgi:hypothetical protein
MHFQSNQLSGDGQMTDVIDFLEKMGQDAQLRYGSQNEVELALESAQIAPALQAAILAEDHEHLNTLLGQEVFCAMLFPGDEEEEDDTEETPSREEDGEEHAGSSLSGSQVSLG